MAYMNCGIPRFYIDTSLYQKATGIISDSWGDDYSPTLNLDPTNPIIFYPSQCKIPRLSPITYFAVLGHNAGGKLMYPELYDDDGGFMGIGYNNHINGQNYSQEDRIDSDGFSIWEVIDNEEAGSIRLATNETDLSIGAVSAGNIYDMPHSPDLNLKMAVEMDGVKNIQSKGGSTLSNASYTKPADWGDAGAWQLGGASNLRVGRRVWDLSFSYLSDTDVFPINASTSYQNYTSSGGYNIGTDPVDINTNEDEFFTNILEGSDFFSQVWNKTMGGHLPFIFQPDSSNNNPDQFAIARFDMSSLTYEQVANNVYNVKLKIRESW